MVNFHIQRIFIFTYRSLEEDINNLLVNSKVDNFEPLIITISTTIRKGRGLD